MKNRTKLSFVILVLASMFFVACSKNLDINNDTSTINLGDAGVNELMVNGIITTAINLGVNYNEITATWAQYVTRRPGFVGIGFDNHLILGSSSNIDRGWVQAYTRAMYDLKAASDKSTNPQIKGACMVMLAYNFQLLTDCYGNIPFSEALKALPSAGGILSPKFDEATTVYDGITEMLEEAITNLNSSELSELKTSNDPLYAGNIQYWIKFANTLKLRVLVRQIEVNPATLTTALAFLESGAEFINNSSEMPQIAFSSNGNQNNNPLYSKGEGSGLGNTAVLSNTTFNALTSRGDTRINAFYNLPSNPAIPGQNAGADQGSGSGAVDKLSKSSALVYSSGAPVILMSSWESDFLQAEVYARSDNSADETKFLDAIYESFAYLGLSDDFSLYTTDNPYNSLDLDSKIRSIAYEKWVAMNALQPTESWIETRRYDTPSRSIFTGVGGIFVDPASNVLSTGTGFPVIFPYSQTEISNNKNAPLQRTDLSNPSNKTFWDN